MLAARPGAGAALTRAVTGLPPALRHRILRRMYTRAYAAFNRRDWEVNTALFHRDRYVLEWASEGLMMPDLQSAWQGRAGYLTAMAHVIDMWPDMHVRLGDIRQVAEERLLVSNRITGRSRSGLTVDQHFTDLHEFRGGWLVHQTQFLHRADALAAAGLASDPFTRGPGG